MDDGISLVLWLAGIALAIVLVVAQFQLFAIRRLLERIAGSLAPEPAPPVAAPNPSVPLRTAEQAERERKIAYIAVGVFVVFLVGILAWAFLTGGAIHRPQ